MGLKDIQYPLIIRPRLIQRLELIPARTNRRRRTPPQPLDRLRCLRCDIENVLLKNTQYPVSSTEDLTNPGRADRLLNNAASTRIDNGSRPTRLGNNSISF